jgi:hypothetical protein
MSPEYGHDDWLRLGDCSTIDDPALALQAYARAQALQPGGRASRALAYQAHAAKDYQTALAAWRSVGGEALSGEELLAATTTALAAREKEQAASWLRSFDERGATPDYRYWSLVAETHTGSDTATVVRRSSMRSSCSPRPATTCTSHGLNEMPNGRVGCWNAPWDLPPRTPMLRRSWPLPTCGPGVPRRRSEPSNDPPPSIRTT